MEIPAPEMSLKKALYIRGTLLNLLHIPSCLLCAQSSTVQADKSNWRVAFFFFW